MKVAPGVLFLAFILATGCGPAGMSRAILRQSGPHLPETTPGVNDASRMTTNRPGPIFRPSGDQATATAEISALVRSGTKISISGARHSMGGHTFSEGATVIDMCTVDSLSLDESRNILTAGAGAEWHEVIAFLNQHGRSVSVMQSNNDFTVGGSLSVNCHGWQNDSQPIASTVESFTIITADGAVRQCSRRRNPELFSLALGGYGLFGVITEVNLRVVPDAIYRARAEIIPTRDYLATYRKLTKGGNAGMAYGRISPAPDHFLSEAIVTVLEHTDATAPKPPLLPRTKAALSRMVFRGGGGSGFGKNFRWAMEKRFGETGGGLHRRNRILDEPSRLYSNRDRTRAEILHEYFVPVGNLEAFLTRARKILPEYPEMDLLNITVRNVERDDDSFLRYAGTEVFGLVMLFNHRRTTEADTTMAALTRELTDAALACGGTYYLPYRPHATPAQFLRSYPQARRFAALKCKYDPNLVFTNRFWETYLAGLASP